MSYRVRRVIMVNIGTPKRGVSQRITEIDPRGGAAVIGPNGVGKTTTLRLIPLFYGALPSTLVSKVNGQSGMIPFVLPGPRSALAFEYERGDHDDDVRLVVLRHRSDGSESAEYRFFRSGFRQELFIKDGHFLDDSGTVDAAKALGISPTEKLTAADYRHVILGIKAQNQRQAELRRLSMDYGLGRKQLTNLDKLVAAMVKEDVNFPDLVQVAVGMVMENTGARAEERDKVALRQSKRQIQLWIEDRRACSESRALEPQVQELRGAVESVRRSEAALREFRTEVEFLAADRREAVKSLEADIARSTEERHAEMQREQGRAQDLLGAVTNRRSEAQHAKGEFENARIEAQEYESKGAASWSERLDGIDSLKARLSAVRTQLSVIGEKTRAVDVRIDGARRSLEQQQRAELESRPGLEKPIRDRLQAQLAAIGDEEEASAVAARSSHEEAAAIITGKLDQLAQELGAARLQVDNPRVEAATVIAVEAAEEAFQASSKAATDAGKVVAGRKAEVAAAQEKFREADAAVQQAIGNERRAREALDAEERLLSPKDGSLLAVLKGAEPATWKGGFAKVIDSHLLERTDLDPALNGEGLEAVFGWGLSTDPIELPAWADDDVQRQAVDKARKLLEGAGALTAEKRQERESVSRALEAASTALTDAEVRESAAVQAAAARETEMLAARAKRSKERSEMMDLAKERKKDIEGQIASTRADAQRQASEFKRCDDDRRASFKGRRDDANARATADLIEVERAVTRRVDALGRQIEELEAVRLQDLEKSGVDLAKLSELSCQEKALAEEERETEGKAALVSRWKAFEQRGGADLVKRLKGVMTLAEEAVTQAEKAKAAHDEACESSSRAFRKAEGDRQERLAKLNSDIARLDELATKLHDFRANYGVQPDTAISVEALLRKVNKTMQELAAARVSLENKFAAVKNKLTSGAENNVRRLVEETLAAVVDTSMERRAAALLEAHRLIEGQVVPQVGSSLKLMLDGIGSFRDTIQRFETEVERFNKKLQEGLRQVEAFPRLRDLELKLTTDFGALDVVKKVARLDELRGMARLMAQDATWLPDEKAELAMYDFMATLEDSGRTEVSLASRVTIRGKVTENDQVKPFTRAEALKHVSSTGLSSLVLITLLVGLLNMIRGEDDVYVAWVTDEVAKFDSANFAALLEMLRSNKVDVVTASPELGVMQYRRFQRRYQMADGGRVKEWTPRLSGEREDSASEVAA